MASPRAYRLVRSLVVAAAATAVVGVALPDRRGAPLPDVVPAPQAIESADRTLFPRGPVRLGAGSRVIVRDGALRGVAESLDDALWSLTDVDVGLATTTTRLQARDGDIVVALDPGLAREEYRLEVTGALEITGGSPSAVSWGVATLLQISSHETGSVLVPRVRVRDAPVYPFRALAVDIASRPHTLGQLQELVEFARFYKINHLQLRLTSDEAVALPTSLLDAGRPWRVYAREDLQALEAFAADRGVTLIPEIGLPGGARALVSADPTLFGLENRLTNPGTVHLAREGVYQAIDAIVGDAAQIFARAPFIHIGGLDASLRGFAPDPETRAFMEAKGLANLAELLRYFTARVSRMVSKRGRRPLVWDLPPDGDVPLPADLGVQARGLGPEVLKEAMADGRMVANASPLPLDISPHRRARPIDLETWSPLRWRHWDGAFPSGEGFELGTGADIAGGVLPVWTLEGFLTLPSLRQRLPRVAESLWTGAIAEDASRRVDRADGIIMSRLRPARVDVRGRIDPDYEGPDLNATDRFARRVVLETEPRLPGDRVLMTLDGTDPGQEDRRRPSSMRLSASAPVRIQVVDQAGRRRGFPWLRFLERRPLDVQVAGALPADDATAGVPVRFVDSVRVSVRVLEGDGQPRYTLSGDEPGPESDRYEGPIVVSGTTRLRVRAFTEAGTPLGDEDILPLLRVQRVSHLARGFHARASGPWSAPAANFLFDGFVDPTRPWTPPDWAEDPWVEVDLGRAVAVGGIVVYGAAPDDVPGYRLRGAGADGQWQILADRTTPSDAGSFDGRWEDEFESQSIRVLRIELVRTPDGGWPSIYEVAVQPPSLLTADHSTP